MHKQIVINSTSNEVRVALLEDHEMVEFSMERADRRRVVGNVYKGKVSAVRPGLQAAFVEIGMEKAGFLHVSDLIHDNPDSDNGRGRRRPRRDSLRPIESMLKEGDEILVQVTKDIIGTKGPRLTADISLPGRFMVMMPKGDHVGVSRKIDERSERHRLRDLLADLKRPEEGGAYIIRTAAIGIEKKMLERDMDYLRNLWTELQEKAHDLPAPTLVHQDVSLIVGMVRDIFKDDIDSLIIDSRQDYQELMQYVKTFVPELKDRVRYYDGDIPIFDRFGIEAELKKSLERKVWMKRGGFLVIDQTEALVAVDVNTGRFTGKKNQAETILKTNLMAAKEVARQVRLRDIGGIIVIDFIDMDSEDHKRRVLTELRSHLKRDRSRNKTFGISDLGLVEMSRQRVQESLKDRLSDDCPFCRGSGQVLSADTLANKVELLLAKLCATRNEKGIQVRANPTLALMLMTERANALQQIARESGMAIDVVDDPRLHREDFQLLSVERNRDLVAEMEKSSGRADSEPRRRSDSRDSRRGRDRDRSRDSSRGSREESRETQRESTEDSGSRGGRRRRGEGSSSREEVAGSSSRRESSDERSRDSSGGSRRGRRRRGRRGRGRRGGEEAAVETRGSREESARNSREETPRGSRDSSSSSESIDRGSREETARDDGRRRESRASSEGAENTTRTRRRRRRGRRTREEESSARPETASEPRESAAEASEGGSSPRSSRPSREGRSRDASRSGSSRSRRDGDPGRGRSGSRRRGERDRDRAREEESAARPSAPAVASPEEYVRPVSAENRPTPAKETRSERQAESTPADSSDESRPTRRRRRRVRRSGVPTRVLGRERETGENGS